MDNYELGSFISSVNNMKRQHFAHLTIKKTNKMILVFLDIFDRLGIIRGYKLFTDLTVDIYLKKSRSRSVFKKLVLISTPGKRVYVSILNLTRLRSRVPNSTFILSTTAGIITDQECIFKNIGGEVLLQIYFL